MGGIAEAREVQASADTHDGLIVDSPAPDPLRLLWWRMRDLGITGMEPQPIAHGVSFDTGPLLDLLNRRGTLGRPNSWPVLDYVGSLKRPVEWEGLLTLGRDEGEPAAAWVMLYGPRNPDRALMHRFYDRPSLMLLLSGYTALRGTCDSVGLYVTPMEYDAAGHVWQGAQNEQVVLGYGSLVPEWTRPPSSEEQIALGALARAICDVLPLPPGVYRSGQQVVS